MPSLVPGQTPLLPSLLLTHLAHLPCLSWGLGGSWCRPGQISASHKGLSTSSSCLGFAVTSPDASISQFQSTRGWWDLALFFACRLCTSNARRKEKRRRDECGCSCRLSAPETLLPGAATCVSRQTHGLCLEVVEWGELEKVQKKGKISEMEAV